MSCYVCSALCYVSAYRVVLLCFALFLVFSVLLCPLFYRDIVVHFLSLNLHQACSQMQAVVFRVKAVGSRTKLAGSRAQADGEGCQLKGECCW